jgi:hypothetical protein
MASASDDFNRADGGLGANWTTIDGAPAISSNTAIGTNGGGFTSAVYSGVSWTNDTRSTATSKGPGSNCGPAVRMASSSLYTYWGNDGNVYKIISQVYTSLGTRSTYTVNDIAKLEVSGTTLTPTKNGSGLSTITDSSLSAGGPGIAFYGNADKLDDWEGIDVSGGGGGGGTTTTYPGADGCGVFYRSDSGLRLPDRSRHEPLLRAA